VTIRILADREPYSAFADSPPPSSEEDASPAWLLMNGPPGLDDPDAEALVLPVEDFLEMRIPSLRRLGARTFYLPYGPVALMDRAFELGCSDYLREPWSIPELQARLRRLVTLRFRSCGSVVELRGSRLCARGQGIELNESERRILQLLALSAPLPVPRAALRAALAHPEREAEPAPGRLIASLRIKLEGLEPGLGGSLQSIRGFGYRLDGIGCG
jgi:two-component system, OmpR family, response regulator